AGGGGGGAPPGEEGAKSANPVGAWCVHGKTPPHFNGRALGCQGCDGVSMLELASRTGATKRKNTRGTRKKTIRCPVAMRSVMVRCPSGGSSIIRHSTKFIHA